MSHKINRREWMAYGMRAAGLFVAGLPARSEEQGDSAYRRPDRSKDAPSLPVAIERCNSYEPGPLRRRLDETLDLLGGFRRLVEGKTVAIKLNLTGGPTQPLGGLPAYRTYHVHPNLVAALCAALHDAGAKRIVLVESHYSRKPPEEVYQKAGWDIGMIAAAGGHKVSWEDTRNRGRWPQYGRLTVPWGGYLYPAFDVNARYEKTDVFISLAKLKDHGQAGVTMAVKNLFGIVPTSLYGGDAPNEETTDYRGEILHFGRKKVPAGVPAELDHGVAVGDWGKRVARVTADCFGARPVDLAVIDGIESNRGGEGPWIKGTEPIAPKLLLAGRNAVCTDAICAAVMGYDPMAGHGQFPFQGDNHLKLLAQVGAGTIDPAKIEVRGLSVKEALHPFNPQRLRVVQAAIST
jgi:uncharacterized protein (DUF362 family)